MGVHRDAEDLAQETFIRLFKYRFRYKPRAKFTTFLYLLARQVWIDTLRKGKRKQEFEERFREHTEVVTQPGHADNGQLASAEQALHRLPEPMRLVVVMSIHQGLKYAEIAEVLKVPEGTVKSRMFNALRRLREDMNVQRN